MSAFYYKNMLIVQYGTNNIYIRNFLLQHYKLWWDKDPFQYRNSHDMIVVFHSLNCRGVMSYSDNRIHNLHSTDTINFYPNGTAIGHMKILANMGKLKVTECTLRGIYDIIYNLPTFREYLVKTKCTTLYWTPRAITSVEAMIMHYKLLDNERELSYTFTPEERDVKFLLECKLSAQLTKNSAELTKTPKGAQTPTGPQNLINILLQNSYIIPNIPKRLNDTNRIIARPKSAMLT